MTDQVAVVGAGAAGAGVAYALRDEPVEVTVLEKSRGVCGRAATRRKKACVYEYGANYLKADDPRVTEIVTAELPTQGLVDIEEPVYTFGADSEFSEGHGEDEHKWTYEMGITQLAKRLFAATDADVRREVHVETLERLDGGWQIYDAEGSDHGTYDAVVLTPPAPQTADLLGQTRWDHDDCRALRQTIASVPYRTVISAALHYPFELDVPWYGAVNDDKEHDIGWISREECKTAHVPPGNSLLIVQMNEPWSVANYDRNPDQLIEAITERTAHLLDDDRLTDPDWTDHQHWRYSQPKGEVDRGPVDDASEHDLYFAGDWVAGEGRIHRALRSGLDVADTIADDR